MAILKKDLHEGQYVLIRPNASSLSAPDGIAKIIEIISHGVGILIPTWDGGHDLNGRLLPPDHRSGHYFAMSELNQFFDVLPEGMVPSSQKIDFDSVILADHKKEQIVHALKQVDNWQLIFSTWGFGKTFEKGRGISMLFYGPPGTGKTLMAQAIAHKLNYSLKVISSADIESSVPGEAERNIRKHFKDSKNGRSVVLFDECDSLVYSRQSVGAIMGAQINELLSQLERFEGITIFTTNRLGTLDEAVNRRLSVKIEFAMPSKAERVKIWQRMFPAEAPLQGTIKWEALAKHEIAGGHIKNAILRAAREAAIADLPDEQKVITMAHLEKGLKNEVEATKEFHRAKHQWEGRYRPEGAELSGGHSRKRGQDLKDFRKSVKEMQNAG